MKPSAVVCLFGAVALSGCNPDLLNTKPEVKGLEGAAPVQTLYDPGAQSEVTLRPGGQLRIDLNANPTTGYNWTVGDGFDAFVIRLTGDEYTVNEHPQNVMGVGGRQVFRFEAVGTGETTLSLTYARSVDDVARRIVVRVSVIK